MSVALLDINDCNLQLWHGGKHLQSPGYALLEGQEYAFGARARAAARLRPRDINTRYWWQLSTEALQPALGPARHTADLVHAHLVDLYERGGHPPELILAVPGSMQRDQLALLLGIAEQCAFAAVGLVNRSVTLGSLCAGPGRLFHLELQLHQAVLSELTDSSGQVELQRTVPLPGCGLLQLQERLVEMVAAAFIRQTRFDPRRKAGTEQHLYDELPNALRALGETAQTNLEVGGYQARIHRDELVQAGQRLLDSAQEAMGLARPDDRFIVDPVAGLLPGLTERFPQARLLAADALPDALTRHREQIVEREQALHFITTLPALDQQIIPRTEQPDPAPAERENSYPEPSHLLVDYRAQPLAVDGTTLVDGWEVYNDGQGWQLRGGSGEARVNGAGYQRGQVLKCGDNIALGGDTSALLIEVIPKE